MKSSLPLIALLAVLGCAVSFADEPTISKEQFSAYLEKEQEATQAEIERLTEWVAGHRARVQEVNSNRETPRDERIEKVRELVSERDEVSERLDRLRHGEEVIYPEINPVTSITGDMGRLAFSYAQTRRAPTVQSGGIVTQTGYMNTGHRIHTYAQVFQVIDDHNVLVQYEYRDRHPGPLHTRGPFWITGIDASGLVDDRPFGMKSPESGEWMFYENEYAFRNIGTRTYATEAGTNTIPAFEVVDIEELRQRFADVSASAGGQ